MSKLDSKTILIMFIGLIITATFMLSIGDQISAQTSSRTFVNTTVVGPAENTTLALEGRSLEGTMTIRNTTADVSNQYVKDSRLGAQGLLTVAITSNSTTFSAGQNINVSYTALPDGHAVNSGDRNIILLILIFAALAMLVFAVSLVMKQIFESKGIK